MQSSSDCDTPACPVQCGDDFSRAAVSQVVGSMLLRFRVAFSESLYHVIGWTAERCPDFNCLLKIYSWVHMMWVSIPSIWQLCSTLMMGVFSCHINTHDLVGTPDLVGTSPSVLWHCWLGDRNGIRSVKKTGCWFVGGDDLTGALHNL